MTKCNDQSLQSSLQQRVGAQTQASSCCMRCSSAWREHIAPAPVVHGSGCTRACARVLRATLCSLRCSSSQLSLCTMHKRLQWSTRPSALAVCSPHPRLDHGHSSSTRPPHHVGSCCARCTGARGCARRVMFRSTTPTLAVNSALALVTVCCAAWARAVSTTKR